jgi:metal-responsive CopG/Arc/MetJ family transcriptional regulator
MGPAMNGLSRETRLQIMLDEGELAAIDDWRFKRRMPSRAAAIRDLLRRGLKAEAGKDTDRSMRSEDFGVINRDQDPEA